MSSPILRLSDTKLSLITAKTTAAAQWCAALSGWPRVAVVAAAGMIATLALPPWHWIGFLVPGFVVLVWALHTPYQNGLHQNSRSLKSVFWTTWVFATAHFIPALWWVSQSMITKGGPAVYMVPVALMGLPMMLALFPAVFTTGVVRLVRPTALFHWALVVALGWTTSEAARSYLFTGFPWHLIGYSWVSWAPVSQTIAIFGVLGTGLITMVTVCLLAMWGQEKQKPVLMVTALAVFVLAVVYGGGSVRLATAELETTEAPTVRVVQPNVRQQEKWLPETRDRQIADLVRLSGERGLSDVDFILWPETAITFLVDRDPRLLGAMDALLEPGQSVLGGAVDVTWTSDGQLAGLTNSMYLIDDTGTVVDQYDKRHLVPFGEYLPFRWVLEPLGLGAVAADSDFDTGSGPVMMTIPALGQARILICYEAIFPHHLWRGARPDIFVVGTNDAWFGDTAGPQQHAAMSRVRALEWGVPMIRAANTGVSLVADAFGREISRIEVNQQGQITTTLPNKLRVPPLYTHWGDGPYFGMVCVLFGLLFFGFSRAGRLSSSGGGV